MSPAERRNANARALIGMEGATVVSVSAAAYKIEIELDDGSRIHFSPFAFIGPGHTVGIAAYEQPFRHG